MINRIDQLKDRTTIGFRYIFKDVNNNQYKLSPLFKTRDECERESNRNINSRTRAIREEDVRKELVKLNKTDKKYELAKRFLGVTDKTKSKVLSKDANNNIKILKKMDHNERKMINHSSTNVDLISFNRMPVPSLNPAFPGTRAKYDTFKANDDPLFDRQGRRKDQNGVGIDKPGTPFILGRD
jgi:hypothetical protein